MKCKLPTGTCKRDGSDEHLRELDAFFRGNETWYARNAMVGVISNGAVKVLKPRGSQKYLEYKQTTDNIFFFAPLEVISLVFTKRLVVLCKTQTGAYQALTGHFLVNYALSKGFSAKNIFGYSLFSIYAVSTRKVGEAEPPEAINSWRKDIGFIGKLRAAAVFGPKVSPNFAATLHPPTHPIKAPEKHKIPRPAVLSLPGFRGITDSDSEIVIVPISFKCIVSIRPGPEINPAVC